MVPFAFEVILANLFRREPLVFFQGFFVSACSDGAPAHPRLPSRLGEGGPRVSAFRAGRILVQFPERFETAFRFTGAADDPRPARAFPLQSAPAYWAG